MKAVLKPGRWTVCCKATGRRWEFDEKWLALEQVDLLRFEGRADVVWGRRDPEAGVKELLAGMAVVAAGLALWWLL